MRQKTALLLAAVLCISLCAGCGSSEKKEDSAGTENAGASETVYVAYDGSTTTEAEPEEVQEERVFVIYCIGEDFKNRVQDFYPEYETVGEDSGMIGNVRVQWHVYSDAQEYREDLDERLSAQADPDTGSAIEGTDPNERIDLFVVDENYLRDYVESGWSLDVKEGAGLTEKELSDQFLYTQQMATDGNGRLKAVSWQATPGVFAYRRSIAKEVLGTDDPGAVQKELENWTKFRATAAKMGDKKYYMLSGYYDAFSAFRFSAEKHWENDGALVIPDAMIEWRNMMADFTKKNYHNKTQIGEAEWVADQGPSGKVFGFFRAIGDIDSRMAAYSLEDADLAPQAGNGIYGDYAVCCGPQTFVSGGAWILASPSSDNLILDKEIMENLTCNSTLLYKIAGNEDIFTNTISGMRRLAGEDRKDAFLGGQDPFDIYYQAATRLSCLPAGNYDRWMGDTFRNSLIKSFTGEMTQDEAMEYFYQRVKARYPELKVSN